jgi:preprotein translocase subunit SecA
MADIREAYGEGLVDPGCILLEDVEDEIASGKEAVLKKLYTDRRHRFVENVIDDLSWWDCFSPEKPNKFTDSKSFHTEAVKVIQPVVAKKKVGRNDTCPCGSGKKYKKCCGK